MVDQKKPDSSKKASSRLLGMKFMQRTMELEQKQQLEQEMKKIISEAEWKIDYEAQKIRVEYQPSYLAFDTTPTVGRMTFQRFNQPTMEEEALEAEAKAQAANGEDDEDDNDEELLRNMRRKQGGSKRSLKQVSGDDKKKGSKKARKDNDNDQGSSKSRTFMKPK
ncbi:hypothetical protein BC940DRAFT_5753 [Gongronella butleri]|nr:hypothetical protein BC940DRAFT_5753 [Gongronella butleri]